MKKILFSLMIVALASTAAIGATRAYFSNSKVLGSNTFSTGTVTIGGTTGFNMSVTGLAPGVSVRKTVQIGYLGSLDADLWLGVSGDGSTHRIADFMKVTIYNQSGNIIFNDYANKLSSEWLKIASGVTYNNSYSYTVDFSIDSSFSDNTKQGLVNTDTVFQIYAIQQGGSHPANAPYEYGTTASF